MQMIFGPTPGLMDDDAVAAAYDWPATGPWVRAMMVTTLDGAAAGPDGLSGSISSSADKAVFGAVRRTTDAVLVGAGTFRAEGYGAIRARASDAATRSAGGQRPAATLAIVSGSLDLPWESDVFTGSAERPVVFAGARATPERRARAAELCDLVVSDDEHVAASDVVAALVARGLRRIVCEGGPTLLESVVRAGLLDEADITVSPMIAGTATSPRGHGLPVPTGFELRHVLTADSFLMGRYVRRAPA